MSMRSRSAEETEPPSITALADARNAALVERVCAVAHLPPAAHVAVIGHRTLPLVLELLRRGCAAVRSLRPGAPAQHRWGRWIVVVAAVGLAGCAAAGPSRYPPFEGVETAAWLAYEVALPVPPPEDLLGSFEASARSHGCMTEPLGEGTHHVPSTEYVIIGDDARYRSGVVASCDEGVIAVLGTAGPTASLQLHYRRPTPLQVPLRFEAWQDRVEGRRVYTRGRLLVGDRTTVEAEGLFIIWRGPLETTT